MKVVVLWVEDLLQEDVGEFKEGLLDREIWVMEQMLIDFRLSLIQFVTQTICFSKFLIYEGNHYNVNMFLV